MSIADLRARLGLTRERLKVVLPAAVLAFGILGAVTLALTGPAVSVQKPETPRPLVRVIPVELQDVQLTVHTYGTVEPRTESDLVPEVSGRVIWVSPSLVSGGSFEAGEPLLRIDPVDYDLALEQARAQLARTESDHLRAKRNLERRKGLSERKVASAAELDDAVNAERIAAAALREARASLAKAERDRERTELTAPYAGRVRSKSVDVGQFVTRGAPLGRIYAVDYAEVRLPIPDDQLAYLDLPLLQQESDVPQAGPAVELRAHFAGSDHTWQGRIVRTEAEIDRRSRMVNAVARIEDPYGRERPGESVPLAVGLFVEAEIQGHRAPAAAVLPRSALRDGNSVWVVGDDDRLRFRAVDVLRAHGNQVVIRSGLASGERVCISPLQTVVDGMEVRAVGAPAHEDERL